MAKGKICKYCNTPMFAVKEDYQKEGSWVTYQCENGKCSQYKQQQKDFESK